MSLVAAAMLCSAGAACLFYLASPHSEALVQRIGVRWLHAARLRPLRMRVVALALVLAACSAWTFALGVVPALCAALAALMLGCVLFASLPLLRSLV